jgi:RNA polymerase sigma-70 factor (ECF subfamily)
MADADSLAGSFEPHRAHLRGVAYRMLGSAAEADDAVQETWLRLSRSDPNEIQNLAGWLTTVVARVSLDMLRSRGSRREDPSGVLRSDGLGPVATGHGPEDEAVLADSVGAALLVVLDALTPAERLAFVLHDMFAVPFDEIGVIVNRSPDAAKQLASRARRKVQGSDRPSDTDPVRQRVVLDAFLAASRAGQFEALVSLLDPDIVLEADASAVRMGSPATIVGSQAVAASFSGRALGAQPALIDGAVGMVWVVGGSTKVAWDFTIVDDKIVHISMLAAPEAIGDLDLVIFE